MGQKAPKLQENLRRSIGRLVLMLVRNVKGNKLSGQVLNVRTGRLRRSINGRTVMTNPDRPEGTVGTNVVYARPHEFGFKGNVTVKSHLRTVKQAFGKSITPVQVQVGSFSRRVDLPVRSFLRSALTDMEPVIRTEINTAVREALK
jgi:phage gpG-like protein